MLDTKRIIFDISQISDNIENEDVVCPKKVVKRANIAANILFGELLFRLTGV